MIDDVKLKSSYSEFEKKVEERNQRLVGKVHVLEEISKLMIGRELKIEALEKQTDELKKKKGLDKNIKIVMH